MNRSFGGTPLQPQSARHGGGHRVRRRNAGAGLISLLILGLVTTCLAFLPAWAGESPPQDTSTNREALLQGERIYRQGMLPSGAPVEAIVKGDITVEGTMFSCESCHMRGGIGSIEGGIATPPTNGRTLFTPLKMYYKGFEQDKLRRPAYTDRSLAVALRDGVDPAGRIMNDIMPRYLLGDKEMALLITYLKTLSMEFSPGITETTLRFATVITEDVPPQDREAMVAPLETYIRNKNNQAEFFETADGGKSRRMSESMLGSRDLSTLRLSLSPWILRGPPESWRGQLEEYYRKEPVFAILGGITSGEWRPVHTFCEENRIPCLFPATDFPVISATDWYTVYLSKGYYQEGEAAARFLNGRKDGERVVQFVRSTREGKALAEGFTETWRDLGHEAPVTVAIEAGAPLTAARVRQTLAREKPAALVVWDGPAVLSALEGLAGEADRPPVVLVSSSLLGKSAVSLREEARGYTYLTYPYRLPRSGPAKGRPGMVKNFSPDTTKIANQTYAILTVLNMAFMKMRGYYYRDTFLDAIAMIMDQEVPLYERLSFGPGQRYASKGCYVVQLSPGAQPAFVRKSDWVIH